MPSFPTSVRTFTTKNSGDTIQPADVNDLQTEVNAIEAGYLNGTANLNSSGSTMNSLSVVNGSTLNTLVVSGASSLATLHVTGNSTLGSTVTFGTIQYQMPSAVPASSGLALVVQSTGTPNVLKWGSVGTLALLKANSGSDSNASAATVDSIAITGLTAKDTVVVYYSLASATQQTADIELYTVTDAGNIVSLSGGAAIAGGANVAGNAQLQQAQGDANHIEAVAQGINGSLARKDSLAHFANTTAWTGSWTLGLRHAGVTAGGTFKYVWSVYKMAGQ